MSIQKNSRGGARKGSGRKKKEPTKVIRVKVLEWEEFLKWKKKFN